MKRLKPVHPGKILLNEFLKPLDISQYRLAKLIHVPLRRINEIVLERRAISVDTAVRLSLFFGTSSSFWLGLQTDYELDVLKLTQLQKIKNEIQPWNTLMPCAA